MQLTLDDETAAGLARLAASAGTTPAEVVARLVRESDPRAASGDGEFPEHILPGYSPSPEELRALVEEGRADEAAGRVTRCENREQLRAFFDGVLAEAGLKRPAGS